MVVAARQIEKDGHGSVLVHYAVVGQVEVEEKVALPDHGFGLLRTAGEVGEKVAQNNSCENVSLPDADRLSMANEKILILRQMNQGTRGEQIAIPQRISVRAEKLLEKKARTTRGSGETQIGL